MIENLGFLEDLRLSYEDPIAHFKQVAKLRTEPDSVKQTLELGLSERLPDDSCSRKNLGYAIPKAVYSRLGLRDFFQYKQRFLDIEYNLNSIFSLLTFNRFLFPSSKKHAYETKDVFFDTYDFSLDDVYRSLDYFASYSTEIQKHLNDRVASLTGRNNSLGYYDVTNYYFEIPNEDMDEFDARGNKASKLSRRRGSSKEHRKDPIIQMGLLMDSNGIPMAFNTFSGNESEKQSLLPTIRRVKKDYSLERIIVVADRGLNTSDNTAYLSGVNAGDKKNNDGYVYGQSIRGADKEFKKWALSQEGYKVTMEKGKDGKEVPFRHKSRVYAKNITLRDEQGKRSLSMNIYQKQMVCYSEKYAGKQKYERDRAVAKAKDLVNNPARNLAEPYTFRQIV